MTERPHSVARFSSIAERLFANGYQPIPIIPGQKRPRPDEWQEGGFGLRGSEFRNDYTGLLTRDCPAVDIDVSDASLVSEIRSIVFEVAGCEQAPPPSRVGMAPRELLLFRTEEPFEKISTGEFEFPSDPIVNGKHKHSKVEILASGQQFVAYAIHPDTNRPYDWNGHGQPLDVPRNQLVCLDWAQACEIIKRADRLLAARGKRVNKLRMSQVGDRQSNGKLSAEDPALLRNALLSVPNANEHFDDWISMLYATKAALGESGFEAFREWSSKSAKHDDEFTRQQWKCAKPNKRGAGSIFFLARNYGWERPRVDRPTNDEVPGWIDADPIVDLPKTLKQLGRICLRQFLEVDETIEFLVDDVLRRGWFYSLTGPTGHGKTGIAVPLALDIADCGNFSGNECNGGPVLYIASENPDDVRARFRVALDCGKRWSSQVFDQVHIIDQSFVLAERLSELAAVVQDIGAVLLIVDTDQAIAMTSADDENSNAGRLEHAKRLRVLTKCSSRPTIVDLCHPVKHVASVDGCVPRGGGAFLNEVDGNFRLWRNGDLVELTSDPNKFRGQPVTITFKTQMVSTEKLKDTKGRLLPFPLLLPVSDRDAADLGREQWTDGNRLLSVMLDLPEGTHRDWARACQWIDAAGKPMPSKVQRLLSQLEKDDPPLAKRRRGGRWALTPAGEKEAKK